MYTFMYFYIYMYTYIHIYIYTYIYIYIHTYNAKREQVRAALGVRGDKGTPYGIPRRRCIYPMHIFSPLYLLNT